MDLGARDGKAPVAGINAIAEDGWSSDSTCGISDDLVSEGEITSARALDGHGVAEFVGGDDTDTETVAGYSISEDIDVKGTVS